LGEVYSGTACDTTDGVEALAVDGSVTPSAMANAAATLKKGNARGSPYVNSPMKFGSNRIRSPSRLDGDPV
jgi:hypothetical protein